jgi:hypothetical protein
VLLKLNMLVTPSFFDLPIEHMVYSGEHLNHSIHIGYGDSVKNAPEFVGYYMLDDYICSKQQLSVGAATLRPMRVAFTPLRPMRVATLRRKPPRKRGPVKLSTLVSKASKEKRVSGAKKTRG